MGVCGGNYGFVGQIQGSIFNNDTKFHIFSRLFTGKSNEITGQSGVESVFVRYDKDVNELFW